MSAMIAFGNLPGPGWGHQNAYYQVIVSVALAEMAEQARVSGILAYMLEQIGDVFHEGWPHRFPPAEPLGFYFADMTEFPEAEQADFARAVRKAATAFREGSLPAELKALYTLDRADIFAERADQLATMCEASLATGRPGEMPGRPAGET